VLAAELYSFAVQRLESFAYLGIADDVHSSVELAAATLGISLDDHAYVPGEKFIPGVKTIKMLSFSAGMKPGEGPASATKEVEVEGHSAETIEDVKALIEEKEAEAQKLYDVAYDLFQVSVVLLPSRQRGLGGGGWGEVWGFQAFRGCRASQHHQQLFCC
jgi:hypothetical protein